MIIEISDAYIETALRYVQIEITGHCNMKCKHCRASELDKSYMCLDDIEKIFKFIKANKAETFYLGVSGGEPFLHPGLLQILLMAKNYGINDIVITTNGSLVENDMLNKINELGINILMQISIDSSDPQKHDEFRNKVGSFDLAMNLIAKIKSYENIMATVRSTILPDTLNEMDKIVQLMSDVGAKEVSFSFVKPIGAAKDVSMVISADQRKTMALNIERLNAEYENRICVSTGDPINVILSKTVDDIIAESVADELLLGGCLAGIAAFNINTNGDVTPCAMMEEVICNINDYENSDEILEAYVSSVIVQTLAERKFMGKCGNCIYNSVCGGCRAIAKCFTGDYMGEDVLCWKI